MELLKKLKAWLSRLFGRKAQTIPVPPVMRLPKIIRVSSFKTGKREFFVPDDVGELVPMESLIFAHQYYAPKGQQRLPLFFKNPHYQTRKLAELHMEPDDENPMRPFAKIPRGKVV